VPKVDTFKDYTRYAEHCLNMVASTTDHDEDKKHLLAMAEAWLGLGDRVQRSVREPDASWVHPALRAKLGG
jgi:hypothetical protein